MRLSSTTTIKKVKMLIEVRPIEKKSWHGKKGRESFTREKKIQALVDSRTNEYATGLSPEDIENLKKKGVQYDLSAHFNPNEPHPFWDSSTATVVLENNTMFFDTSRPLDFIKVKLMKASKYVANSLKEYEEGLWPDATHVIFDENEEIERLASQFAIKKKVILESAKLSKERKISLIMILSGKDLRGKSDDFVEVELERIIEEKPTELYQYMTQDASEVELRALVLQALNLTVLRRKGHKIMYFDSVIGDSIESVMDYLRNPDNQDLKFRIIEMVQV